MLVLAGALALVAGLGVAGASEPAYPLRVGPQGRCLVDQAGHPFLIHGDTPWSLTHNLTYDEAVRYMQDRKARGFDALMVSVPDAYGPDGKADDPPDRQGHRPFVDGDLTRPVEAYWAHVDRVFRKAEQLGLLLLVAPAYLGCCQDGYLALLQSNGPERCRAYGRWLGRRYASFANIVWVHGGDRNPFDVRDEVRAVALGIRETDHRHLHTAHWASDGSGLDYFADEGWLDFNSSYTYGPVGWRVVGDRLRHPERPTFLIETHYENDFGKRSADDTRAFPYRALLAGAAGHMFGNKPLWYCGEGWEAALDSPGSRYMRPVRALFESRAWYTLEPDLAHAFVVEGHGDSWGDGVAAAVTRGGGTLIAYLPSKRTIRVDLDGLSGSTLRAWWFDPRTGTPAEIGRFARSGLREFEPPAEGDWVLVIDDDALGLPPPGSWTP